MPQRRLTRRRRPEVRAAEADAAHGQVRAAAAAAAAASAASAAGRLRPRLSRA